MKTQVNEKVLALMLQDIIDRIGDYEGTYVQDLHNELYNTDYFIIGTYRAEQWISENFGSVFEAIKELQEYEKVHFGENYTDISSPENVADMLAYIYGEYALSYINSYMDSFDEELTSELIEEIKQDALNEIEKLS